MSDADKLRVIRDDLCARAWRPQTYSSHDTEQTQLEARANNAARAAYCKNGE